MKEQENPLKPIKTLEVIPLKMNLKQSIGYFLGPNEFKN